MTVLLWDGLGYSFYKVVRLTLNGFALLGYKDTRVYHLYQLFPVLSEPVVAVLDTKMYERVHERVRYATSGKLVVWSDSPASPRELNQRVYERVVHVVSHPYWARVYSEHGIRVDGWIPRPIAYHTAVEVSSQPRDELCSDIWARLGRYVITVGSDNIIAPPRIPRKGLDAYDRLCEHLRRTRGIKCLYVGNNPLRNVVKLSSHGRLSEYDLLRYIRCAELFIWPSRSEGFGMPPVEAMAVGTPVVCSNAPFNDHVVTEFRFDIDEELDVYAPEPGFHFRIFNYNEKSLVETVEYALDLPPEEREAIGLKAISTREYYRPEAVALALLEVINHVGD